MRDSTGQEKRKDKSRADQQVAPVDLDEMAFAIALFFAAARGQVPALTRKVGSVDVWREMQIQATYPGEVGETLADMEEATTDEFQLACAVTVIWHHYDGAEHQQAVCARLVAFYSLMMRTHGRMASGHNQAVGDAANSLLSGPEVIQAIATAPLTADGQFQDLGFRSLVTQSEVGRKNLDPRTSPDLSRARVPIPVTNIVQELTELLFACESTIARSDGAGPKRFGVFEKLCRPLEKMAGPLSLQPLLSRALIATQVMYPWLSEARVTSTGLIEGLENAQVDLHPHEALRGELALMGFLVELLRSLLGDAVTLQLLRSVWPLAFLNVSPPVPAVS